MGEMQQALPPVTELKKMVDSEIGLYLLPRFGTASRPRPIENVLADIARDEYGGNREALDLLAEGVSYLHRSGLLITAVDTGYTGYPVLTLSRRGKRALESGMLPAESHAPSTTTAVDLLHPKVVHAYREMQKGPERYGRALNEAFTQVEVAVRNKTKFSDDGVKLMRRAFGPPNGPLCDPAMPSNEAEGFAHIAAGAIGFAKNPGSHREVKEYEFDAQSTLRLLLLASELLYRVDFSPAINVP